jgi:outer membrane protein assembly factor BamB
MPNRTFSMPPAPISCAALLLAGILTFFAPRVVHGGGQWPEFRGPSGDGHAQASGLPLEWSEERNVKWKTPIAGRGWSTPVVWDGQIWLTTATPEGKEMSVVCVDRATGKILHQEVLYRNEKPEPLGNPVNGYASPTGFIEEGRVFVHFGSYGTCCIDTKSFRKIWERRDLPCRHYRGPGSSLFSHKELLILSMDGVDVQYLTALDKATGKTVWRSDRSVDFEDLDTEGKPKSEGDFRKAYSTPILASVGGKLQLISTGSKASYGHDPDSGKEIWKVRYSGFSNACRPAYADGMVFLNTGFGKANLLAVPLTAQSTGDITSTIAWEEKKRIPLKTSMLIHDGLLYLIADDGQFTVLEAKTGQQACADRIEGNFAASPILADGKILLCNEQGTSYWLAPGRTLSKLAQNKLADGMLASPVAIGAQLILRTKSHLYCIEKSP